MQKVTGSPRSIVSRSMNDYTTFTQQGKDSTLFPSLVFIPISQRLDKLILYTLFQPRC